MKQSEFQTLLAVSWIAPVQSSCEWAANFICFVISIALAAYSLWSERNDQT